MTITRSYRNLLAVVAVVGLSAVSLTACGTNNNNEELQRQGVELQQQGVEIQKPAPAAPHRATPPATPPPAIPAAAQAQLDAAKAQLAAAQK